MLLWFNPKMCFHWLKATNLILIDWCKLEYVSFSLGNKTVSIS